MASSPISAASGVPSYPAGTVSALSSDGVPPGPNAALGASAAMSGTPAGAPVSPEAVQKAVADANTALAQGGTELNFVFDKQANDMIVKVVDTQTRQVVQQFPAQWMTAAARALSDATPGALINTNA